ncbi:HD-GYP domain-containing protein [Anaerospora sp.]|uniref:HD-GYP domain-containing protein n=1 Tax=Anaerospora sp. TaxID=1960278 RepID=UPI0028997598|nr:HD-GYP domain-containing protein [Anaerospora sp.]
MSYLSLSEIKSGMTLEQVLVSPDGKMVFGQGTIVNDCLLARLNDWKVEGAEVAEEAIEFDFAEIEKIISVVTLGMTDKPEMKKMVQHAAELHMKIETELKRIFMLTRYHGAVPMDTLIHLVDKKIYPRLSQLDSFEQLHTQAAASDYLYRHALDVAFIAGYLGRWLGYGDGDIWNLTLAGLVHDIGKTKINFEMLSKSGRLNADEFKIAKNHTVWSYQLLAQTEFVSTVVLKAVLEHHEKLDGSGYPYRLQGNEITMLARIIAVADIYDALISNRYYHKGISPQEAIEIMVFQMANQLDTHVLACLIENLAQIGMIKIPVLYNSAI